MYCHNFHLVLSDADFSFVDHLCHVYRVISHMMNMCPNRRSPKTRLHFRHFGGFFCVCFSIISWCDFIWGQFPLYCARRCIYVARNFCGCPACTSSADVTVRTCHEILLGVGPLESHGSQRLLLYGETLLLRTRSYDSYKHSCERNKRVLGSVFDGWLRCSRPSRQPACMLPCAHLVILLGVGALESHGSQRLLLYSCCSANHMNTCCFYFDMPPHS